MADPELEAIVAACLLVANIACATAVGVRVASRVAADRLDRALTATLLLLAQAAGIPLLLAMLTVASRVPLTIAHVTILVLVLRFVPRGDELQRERLSVPGLVSLALAAALLVPAAAPALRAFESAHGETRHYHVSNLATWLQRETFWTLPFQNPGLPTATHPGDAEMVGLWLVLPSHGDEVAYLMILPWALLAVLAAAAIARALGGAPGWGALCATALLAAPHLFRTHAYTLASDLPAAAGLAAAIVFLLRARDDPSPRWLLLAGTAAGLAVGSKYTVLLPLGVVVAWTALTMRPVRRVLWLAPGLLLLAAPWFVRNGIETGNPVFPQEIKIGETNIVPGVDTPLEQLATTIAEHAVKGHATIIGRWARLAAELWGPIALLAIAGVLAALLRRPRSRAATLVGIAGLLCAVTYLVLPLSGGGPRGLTFLLASNLRYALPALLLGVAAAGALAPTQLRVVLVVAAIGYGLYRVVERTNIRPDLAVRPWIVAAAILAALATYAIARHPSLPRPSRALIAVVLVIGVGGTSVVIYRAALAPHRSALERAMELVSGRGPVIVLGVADLRSILGRGLNRRLTTLSDGGAANERAYRDPARLSAALESSPYDVLVLRVGEGVVSLPAGWLPPPDWLRTFTSRAGIIYIRR